MTNTPATLTPLEMELLAALKKMRANYGNFYKGNCYITVSYEKTLKEVNTIADAAIAKAEGK